MSCDGSFPIKKYNYVQSVDSSSNIRACPATVEPRKKICVSCVHPKNQTICVSFNASLDHV